MSAMTERREKVIIAAGRIASVALVFAAVSSIALRPTRLLAEPNSIFQNLGHTGWSNREGAPSNIEGLAQTSEGYLWIATSHGLYHFDGVSFEPFAPARGSNLSSKHLIAMKARIKGGLWVAYADGGTAFIDSGLVTNYSSASSGGQAFFYKFAEDLDGTFWAATSRGLQKFDGQQWAVSGTNRDIYGRAPTDLFLDRDGRLWVLSTRGISYLPRGEHDLRPSGLHYDNFLATMTETPDGTYWVSGIKGKVTPLRLHDQLLTQSGPKLDLRSLNVMTDRSGTLWIMTTDAGLECLKVRDGVKLKTVSHLVGSYRARDGLTGNEGAALIEDKEGDIWTATSGGLDRFTPIKLQVTPLPSGARALSIVRAENRGIYATTGAVTPGILHVGAKQWTRLVGAPHFLTTAYRDP